MTGVDIRVTAGTPEPDELAALVAVLAARTRRP
ncbi:acyl-CoA carboxylase epsilon subunit, partial [Stackebrandtia sp.]